MTQDAGPLSTNKRVLAFQQITQHHHHQSSDNRTYLPPRSTSCYCLHHADTSCVHVIFVVPLQNASMHVDSHLQQISFIPR
eukprot:scaffold3951_cov69-Cyclotella_meneghiniana.AAC.6